jgi:hypothetical protein
MSKFTSIILEEFILLANMPLSAYNRMMPLGTAAPLIRSKSYKKEGKHIGTHLQRM